MPYVLANGIRLRYELSGNAAAPSVLLLHGLGSGADDWLLQIPALAAHFCCLAVDFRGHGLSDRPPGPYSIPLFTADVSALLALLGISASHVLGLSLGGLVAQQLALENPARVRSLVLINTFPGFWPPDPALLRRGWERFPALLHKPDMEATAARVARQLFPRPDQETLRAAARARLAQNEPLAYREALRAVLRFHPPAAALRRVTCPTLIIAGEQDRVVPHRYKERLYHLLPNARMVTLPASGHASTIDAPDRVNRAVLEFLLPMERS